MLKPLITCTLSIAVLLAPLSAAFIDLGPHCFGHDNPPQLASQDTGETLHGVHHADCRWLNGGRNLLAVPPSMPVGMLLACSGHLPVQSDQSFRSQVFTDFSRRAPPVA